MGYFALMYVRQHRVDVAVDAVIGYFAPRIAMMVIVVGVVLMAIGPPWMLPVLTIAAWLWAKTQEKKIQNRA
ncbi:MAG TPA: hypothetical protein VEX36_01635 [Thermoleophilaceae bacterium]|nr:hypothetical protein [Thermoleophilaceae bacterium]